MSNRQIDKRIKKTQKRVLYCDVRADSHFCNIFNMPKGRPQKQKTGLCGENSQTTDGCLGLRLCKSDSDMMNLYRFYIVRDFTLSDSASDMMKL